MGRSYFNNRFVTPKFIELLFQRQIRHPQIFELLFFLQARINEAEECIEGLSSKVTSTEKIRNRYHVDLVTTQFTFRNVINNLIYLAWRHKRVSLCQFTLRDVINEFVYANFYTT